MDGITMLLRTLNVPDHVCHRRRKEEIEELVDYLSISMEVAEELQLVVVSPSTPSADVAGLPWLKTDTDGNPIGLFKNYNGNWVNALAYHPTHATRHVQIQTGTVDVVVDDEAAEDEYKDYGEVVTFDVEYSSAPVVLVSLSADSELGQANPARLLFYAVAATTGFNLWAMNQEVARDRTCTFSWVAIGAIVQTDRP